MRLKVLVSFCFPADISQCNCQLWWKWQPLSPPKFSHSSPLLQLTSPKPVPVKRTKQEENCVSLFVWFSTNLSCYSGPMNISADKAEGRSARLQEVERRAENPFIGSQSWNQVGVLAPRPWWGVTEGTTPCFPCTNHKPERKQTWKISLPIHTVTWLSWIAK